MPESQKKKMEDFRSTANKFILKEYFLHRHEGKERQRGGGDETEGERRER